MPPTTRKVAARKGAAKPPRDVETIRLPEPPAKPPGKGPTPAQLRAATKRAAAKRSNAGSTNADLAAEAAPPEKPEGAPDFATTLMAIRDFRVRAKATRMIDGLEKSIGALENVGVMSGEIEDFNAAADAFDVLGQIEDLMTLMAVDVQPSADSLGYTSESFDAWRLAAGDEQRIQLAGWFMAQHAVGEASASPT